MRRPWQSVSDGLLLAVRATPRARADEIAGNWIDADGRAWLNVRVRAAPDGGDANKAIIALLAKVAKVPRNAISQESGGASRLKRFKIVCNTYEMAARLEQLSRGERA